MMTNLLRMALGSLLALPAWAQVEVGFVEDFSGEPEHYRLERDGSPVPVRILTPLQTGDRVSVEHPEGRIQLRLGEQSALTLDGSQGEPFVVAGGGESATLFGNLARWAVDWTQGEGEDESTVALVTRGDGFALRGVPAAAQRIPATRESLWLAWSGGSPPFSWSLRDGAGALRASGQDLPERRQHLRWSGALVPGAWRLELRDAEARELVLELEAVAAASLEPEPREATPFAHLVRARLLLDGLGEAGRLWAYQEVSDVADHYAPAAALRDALERGRAPVPDDS